MMYRRIAAVVVNDLGDILPYTTRSTLQECEEYASQFFPAWKQMKKRGAKVVQIEIRVIELESKHSERGDNV